MYIEPTSTIKILHNVPLDETYEHTIYFHKPQQGYHDPTGLAEQYNYFASLTKFNLTNQMYQRVQRGYIRVHINAERLYDCNYLMFQNTGFSYTEGGVTHPAKWFYAFIKSVEYVNNEVSEIRFSIDVMQTWMFDYQVKPSFVIREHSTTDQIGDNIQDENIGTGEMIYNLLPRGASWIYNKNKLKVVVAASFKDDSGAFVNSGGGLYGGLYSGLYFNQFNNIAEANDFLVRATDDVKSDGIVSIFMFPEDFIVTSTDGNPAQPPTNTQQIPKNTSWTYTYGGLSGPRNKKLYCYPFNYLMVKGSDGATGEYKWEFFSDANNATFWHCGAMNPAGQIAMVPMAYNGEAMNYQQMCVLNSLPQCAFTIDAYRAWIAQQGGEAMYAQQKLMIPLQHALINFGTGAANVASQSGGSIGGFSGSLNSIVDAQALIYDYLKEKRVHENLPPQLNGINTNVLDVALNTFGFTCYNVRVRPEYAAMIDGYFDKYGYIVNRIKTPNIHVREYWTYTRTASCVIEGSVPADDAEKICHIFDSGITHWVRGANVGDYTSHTNRCIAEINS